MIGCRDEFVIAVMHVPAIPYQNGCRDDHIGIRIFVQPVLCWHVALSFANNNNNDEREIGEMV